MFDGKLDISHKSYRSGKCKDVLANRCKDARTPTCTSTCVRPHSAVKSDPVAQLELEKLALAKAKDQNRELQVLIITCEQRIDSSQTSGRLEDLAV